MSAAISGDRPFVSVVTPFYNTVEYLGHDTVDGDNVYRKGKKNYTLEGRDIAVPMMDINTVSAGGGTIAKVDRFGALQVGPESAGAVPGPACYSRGGTMPAITDCNVVLGYIGEDSFSLKTSPRMKRSVVPSPSSSWPFKLKLR